MYISLDDGANWQSMQFNLPVTPITDLAIHKREKELVARRRDVHSGSSMTCRCCIS